MPTNPTGNVTVYGPRHESKNREKVTTTTGVLTREGNRFRYDTDVKDNSPQFVYLLTPGEEPQTVKLNELHKRAIRLGEHLLLPATKDHEDQLIKFLKSLNYFPPDIRGSILDVLRSPDFEFRLTQLEQAGKPSAQPTPDESAAHSSPSWISRLDLMTALLVIMLAGGLFMLATLYFDLSPMSWFPESPNDDAPTTLITETTPPPPPPPPTYSEVQEDLRAQLLDTTTGQAQSKAWLKANHFDTWLDPASEVGARTNAYALGLVELALAANNAPSFDGLHTANDETVTTSALVALKDGNSYPFFSRYEAAELLAYAFCQVDRPDTDEPVPYLKHPPATGEEIRFRTDNCTNINESNQGDAVRQLERLVEWLQESPPAAEEPSPGEPDQETPASNDNPGPQD